MVFLIVEKIKGSPVSARVQTAAMVVGLVLIASVFLITLFYDVSRLGFFSKLF
jgi:membrane-associated protease RseP (regulator of RpoE activity)